MATIIDLQRGQLLRLDVARGDRVEVLYGAVWLTEPRRLEDVFAASGDEVVLDHGGRVLIEAQGFARLIVPASRPTAGRERAIARLLGTVRRWLPAPSLATT